MNNETKPRIGTNNLELIAEKLCTAKTMNEGVLVFEFYDTREDGSIILPPQCTYIFDTEKIGFIGVKTTYTGLKSLNIFGAYDSNVEIKEEDVVHIVNKCPFRDVILYNTPGLFKDKGEEDEE